MFNLQTDFLNKTCKGFFISIGYTTKNRLKTFIIVGILKDYNFYLNKKIFNLNYWG